MRTINFLKLLGGALITLLFSAQSLVFALDENNCVDSAGCQKVTDIEGFEIPSPTYPDCEVLVDYEVWDCNGATAVYITNYQVQGSCEALDEDFEIYHYNINTIEEWITITILQIVADDGNLPDCNNPDTIFEVYTKPCGIWVGCEYEVDPATRECDPGYNPPYPEYGVNPTKVKVYKWQSCGETCCRNTYTICEGTSEISQETIIKMKKINSEQIGECTGAMDYTPLECQSGCR